MMPSARPVPQAGSGIRAAGMQYFFAIAGDGAAGTRLGRPSLMCGRSGRARTPAGLPGNTATGDH
jgi:hypothetical protein